jgi:hypothetical protein
MRSQPEVKSGLQQVLVSTQILSPLDGLGNIGIGLKVPTLRECGMRVLPLKTAFETVMIGGTLKEPPIKAFRNVRIFLAIPRFVHRHGI